jgi:hypothetical protein
MVGGMFDALRSGLVALRSVVEEIDPATLSGDDAAAGVALFAEAERLACAGRTLLAKRVDETSVWAKQGHRSAAVWLAEQAGTTVGAAMGTLQTSWNLERQPAVDEALRAGRLSPGVANEISDAAAANPGAEGRLVAAVERLSVRQVREECNRARAGAEDEADREARQRVRRSFRAWTERDGMVGFAGRVAALDGAAVLAVVEAETERVFREHRRAGDFEPRERYAADALLRLLGVGTASAGVAGEPAAGAPAAAEPAAGGRRRRARANVRIRVDLAALRRGYVAPGERCEAEGVGPVAVTDVQALIDERDTLVEALLTDGDDIVAISRLDRHIPPALRTAIEERHPTCAIDGCDRTDGLEIDHVIPFAKGGPTSLANLIRLCKHHHALKTHKRWRLMQTEQGGWRIEPPETRARTG